MDTYGKWTNKFPHKLICIFLGHLRFGIQSPQSNLKRMLRVREKGNLFRANKKQALGENHHRQVIKSRRGAGCAEMAHRLRGRYSQQETWTRRPRP